MMNIFQIYSSHIKAYIPVIVLIFFINFFSSINILQASPLTGANADMDTFFSYDAGTSAYTTDTTDANSATANDVSVVDTAGVGDIGYFGMNYRYDNLYINVGTAATGASGAITWEYCTSSDCSTWATLAANEKFTSTGTKTIFINPTATSTWVSGTVNGTARYWIRARVTTAFTTPATVTQISTREFNLKVKVVNELGTPVTGLPSGALTIANCSNTARYNFREIGSGEYEWGILTQGADTNCDYAITSEGYVRSSISAIGSTSTTLTDLTATPKSLPYTYKITSITTEGTTSNITSSITALTAGDATGQNSCVLSGGSWYCPITLANSDAQPSATITLDGYVQESIDLVGTGTRTLSTDTQVSDTVTGVKYGYKITGITTEGPALNITTTTTALSVGDATGQTACTASGGIWYCPVAVANSDSEPSGKVTLDGYVEESLDLVSTSTRSANSSSQVTDTLTGVKFAYKLTALTSEAATDLTTTASAVTVGDSTAQTSCMLAVGAWYCPVPLANSDAEPAATATANGYVQESLDLPTATTRLANTTAQIVDTLSNIKFSYKIIDILDEINQNLDSAETTVVTGDDNSVTCSLVNTAWYCAIPLAQTGINIQVDRAGYITKTASFDADRTLATDAQQTKTISGIIYNHKVVINDTSGTDDPLTVSIGNVNCTEGSNSTFYCAIDINSDDAVTVNAMKARSDGAQTTATDRSSNNDAQATYNLDIYGWDKSPESTPDPTPEPSPSPEPNLSPSAPETNTSAETSGTNVVAIEEPAITVNPLDVPADGVVTKMTLLKQPNLNAGILIQKDTRILNQKKEPFSGSVAGLSFVPQDKLMKALGNTLTYRAAFYSKFNDVILYFNKETLLTLPLPLTANADKAKIYYYNFFNKEYTMLREGGVVSADKKTISSKSNFFTLFLIVEENPAPKETPLIPTVTPALIQATSTPNTSTLTNTSFSITENLNNRTTGVTPVYVPPKTTGEQLKPAADIKKTQQQNTSPTAGVTPVTTTTPVNTNTGTPATATTPVTTGTPATTTTPATATTTSTATPATTVSNATPKPSAEPEAITATAKSSQTTETVATPTQEVSAIIQPTSVIPSIAKNIENVASDTSNTTTIDTNNEDEVVTITTVTRGEMIKFLTVTFGYEIDQDATPSFRDIKKNSTYAPYVAAAEKAGLIKGYNDRTFRANNRVNRAEALKLLIAFSKAIYTDAPPSPYADIEASAWYAPYVNFAYAHGMISAEASDLFGPNEGITTTELGIMTTKVLEF